MSEKYTPEILRFLRHASSFGNEGDIFEGGGPDADRYSVDRKRGPTKLTPLGRRQAYAAGIAVAGLTDVTVERITTSRMNRAIHTGVLFAEAYGEDVVVSPDRIPNFHEIRHGSLEWRVSKQEAAARRKETIAKMTELLLTKGLSEELKGMAPWVIPTGQGDGETYLSAGLRGLRAIESHLHTPNEIIIGHNGAMRQMRVLAMNINRADRGSLYGQYASPEELNVNSVDTLIEAMGARAVIDTIEMLYDYGMPDLDYVNDRSKRIGNAELVEVGVDPATGIWTPIRRIKPVLPTNESAPLNNETVGLEIVPFTHADVWL